MSRSPVQGMEWVGSGRLMLCTALEYQLLDVATGTPTPLFTLPVRGAALPLLQSCSLPQPAFCPTGGDRTPCRCMAAARHADGACHAAPYAGHGSLVSPHRLGRSTQGVVDWKRLRCALQAQSPPPSMIVRLSGTEARALLLMVSGNACCTENMCRSGASLLSVQFHSPLNRWL